MTTRSRFKNLRLFLAVLLAAPGAGFTQEPQTFQVMPVEAEQATLVAPGKQATVQAAGTDEDGLVSVFVKFTGDSLATYRGGIPGLAAMNADVTGAEKLDITSPASKAYLEYLDKRHEAFEEACEEAIPAAKVTHEFKIVGPGVSMVLPARDVPKLASLPGVEGVYRDEPVPIGTYRSPEFIGAQHLLGEVGGQNHAGEGIIVGVIDTGIWPEHPAYSDPDPAGNPYPEPPPPPSGVDRACQFGSDHPNDPPFECNNKLIGAYRFMETFDTIGPPPIPGEFFSARDNHSHGTHTSSTAAGNAGVQAQYGLPAPPPPLAELSGIAPRAHVIAYKVCFTAATGQGSCFPSDSMAAAQQAIKDGVNVINFSIGGGTNPYSPADINRTFLDLYAAGIFVSASAGNAGPGPDTVLHRGPWVMSVGASTTDLGVPFIGELNLFGNGAVLNLKGASTTGALSDPTPVVRASAFGNPLCQPPAPPPGAFTGKVVVCDRGVNPLVEKSLVVAQGGGVGVIIRNVPGGATGVNTIPHWLPAVHLDTAPGSALIAFLTAHTDASATIGQGSPSPRQGDVMAGFSSRGGPGQTLGVSKPDVTAPGVQILAGISPAEAVHSPIVPASHFEFFSGTSMSAPHVAGAGALLKQLHPNWTPGQIKSALMTTAKTEGVFKENGTTPATPFDRGSGRIDLTRAGRPGLTFDESAENYLALQSNLSLSNYPSLYLPNMIQGRVTVRRTVFSELRLPSLWFTSVDEPPDVDVKVPFFILVPGGGRRSFDITVDARNVPVGQVRHANLTLRDALGRHQVDFPITLVRRAQGVDLDKSCDPAEFPQQGTTDCTINITNNRTTPATVSLSDFLPLQLRFVPGTVVGAVQRSNRLLTFDGTIPPATPATINVVDDSSPGYVSLPGLGVAPFNCTGNCDDVGINLDLSGGLAVKYLGVSYTTVGMITNGFVQPGGVTSVAFINQNLPNPAIPNNTLAPFWSDLHPLGTDGQGNGRLYFAILTDGINRWLVMEWNDVQEFGNPARRYTFQVWMGVDGTEDNTFAYNRVDAPPPPATVGAENETGTVGSTYYFNGTGTLPTPATELRVNTTAAIPTVHTITFRVRGVLPGEWTNCAEMTSNQLFGTALGCFSGVVTRR